MEILSRSCDVDGVKIGSEGFSSNRFVCELKESLNASASDKEVSQLVTRECRSLRLTSNVQDQLRLFAAKQSAEHLQVEKGRNAHRIHEGEEV